MALLQISREFPSLQHRKVRVRNGVAPDYRPVKTMADAINYITAKQRKMVFYGMYDLQNMPNPEAPVGGSNIWHFQFHSGHASESNETLELIADVLLRPNSSFLSPDPNADQSFWYLDVGGTQSDTKPLSKFPDSNQYFDDYIFSQARVDIDADTDYECFFHHEDEVNLVACRVYELHSTHMDTSDTITIDSRLFAPDNPITDAQHKKMCAETLHSLFSENSCHLFSVSPTDELSAEVIVDGAYKTTSTSYVNLFDGSAGGAAGANTLGFLIPTRYMAPLHDTSKVKCRIAVLAQWSSGGTGGEFRVHDGSSTLATLDTFTSTAGGEWKTADFELDDQANGHKIDLEFKSTSATFTFAVYAVNCYLYEV